MKKSDFINLIKRTGNYEDAKIIADFKERLTADGFEHYVKDLFATKKFGFRTKANGGIGDRWVDVWAWKTLSDGTVYSVAIQCKKWRNWEIKKRDVAEFWWDVEQNRKKYNQISFFFLTTTRVTDSARRFCEEREIHISDEKILLEMHSDLNLYEWMGKLAKSYSEQKLQLFVNPSYFEKKCAIARGFEKQMLGFRLDSAFQLVLFKTEMSEQFKKAWEELSTNKEVWVSSYSLQHSKREILLQPSE